MKGYFYGCSIPTGLSQYFCFDDVGFDFISSLDKPDLLDGGGDGCGRWCPALKVLPMGWSWSFFFAQVAHATEVERALQLPPDCILQDKRPPPTLTGDVVLALPYCDNLTVASPCAHSANEAREQVTAHCSGRGCSVQEDEQPAGA